MRGRLCKKTSDNVFRNFTHEVHRLHDIVFLSGSAMLRLLYTIYTNRKQTELFTFLNLFSIVLWKPTSIRVSTSLSEINKWLIDVLTSSIFMFFVVSTTPTNRKCHISSLPLSHILHRFSFIW